MNTATETPQEISDPLLACLLWVAKLKGIPCSQTSLIAGIPLVDGKLTPELFIRSAERVGLDAKVVEKPLSQIPDIVFPVTLLLERNAEEPGAVVLVSSDAEEGSITILEPSTGVEKVVQLDALDQDYLGYAIYTRPIYKLDEDIEETHLKQSKDNHWFWSTIVSSWRIYRDVLIASFLINLFAIANPLFVMNVYDRVVPNNAIETLWALAFGVLIVFVFDAVLKGLRAYFIEVAGKKSDILLSSFLLDSVLGAKYSEKPISVGAFTSQFRDFDQVRNFYTSSSITAFVDLPFVIIFLLLFYYIGGSMVMIPLVAIVIILAYSFLMRRPIQNAIEQTYAMSAQKNALLVESMVGLETIKTQGAEGFIQGAWEQSVGHLSIWGQKMRLMSASVGIFSGAITQITQIVIVIVGVYAIAEREITMGALIASVILAGRVLTPISQAVTLVMSYDQTKIALQALDSIVNTEQERNPKKPFVKREELKGEIQFKHVDFHYPNEEHNSLEGVTFTIKQGEKVAILGRIGSGKSTIQKLLLNLYKPSSGSILLDGIDIQQIDPADLRHHIAYMPQDITLFSGTVKSNIVYGCSHIADREVINASDISGVKQFIDQHPLGFDRAVGERGQFLSGGQRQSVGLARTMLNKEATLYLFDEPTSGMDSATEAKVIEKITEVISQKTVLLVTHKASLLALVDRLLVIDNGRIIADGPKAAVLDALKQGDLRAAP